ncbi:antiterminator Q family protein [Pseudomonas sp. RIT-PI-AD]|uniref:antiterminator Q family protein n=1 Tax=Pseudomonas sp. RIT-PI-AD TaxID=3035294 RepID=UPI0021D88A6F|nr:antiterminator Q family protein [Pseudomonas sp. RIT-PI-AD]
MNGLFDTVYLLQEWGIWLRYEDGVPRYVSAHAVLTRGQLEETDRRPTASISEDLCMLVDRVVARLCHRDQQMGNALFMYYRYRGMSYRTLGRELGVTHMKAQELVRSAEAWVDSRLCQLNEAA